MRVDRIWTGARMATLDPGRPGRGVIERGALAARGGRIAWVGPADEKPAFEAAERIDLEGRRVTPGLIDCHTHLVYAGDRAREFELRLAGASYEEIAHAGGGILSTVDATRAATEAELVEQPLPRLDALIAEGPETATEARQLRAAHALGSLRPVRVATTFLGAHALLREPEGDKDGYIARLCGETLPAIAGKGLANALFRLTVDEIIAGMTREAARALGWQTEAGTLEAGKGYDLAIWNVERLAELPYRMALNPLCKRIWRGQ